MAGGRPEESQFHDHRPCNTCGRPYSADEELSRNDLYWGPPYNYGSGSGRYCLACWLGVGPIDFPDWPAIVVQSLIVLGEKTPEGDLIEGVRPVWEEIVRLVRADQNALYQITPRQFEELIAGAYHRRGFDRVTLTPRSGDFGRDVIAEKTGWGCVKIVDQVKLYHSGHLVTADEVRALGFVMQADQAANKGVVTTTSDFAPRLMEDPFIKPYLPTRIELINGTELAQRLAQIIETPES